MVSYSAISLARKIFEVQVIFWIFPSVYVHYIYHMLQFLQAMVGMELVGALVGG